MMTESITIGGETYEIKTRLGWLEQRRIDEAGYRLYTDGKTISKADSIDDLPEVQIVIDAAEKDYKRLCARLVGYKPIEVQKINPAHVVVLLARIAELEAEAAREIAALNDASPLP